MKAARVYQVGFVQYFNELMAQLLRKAGQAERGSDANLDEVKFDMDKLPALDFREANLTESWSTAVFDFLILFLLFACLFMVAYVGFIRSDVR